MTIITDALTSTILDLSRQARIAPLSPWVASRLARQIAAGAFPNEDALRWIGGKLVGALGDYRLQTGVGTAVLGMSGGVDSALSAAMLKAAGWRVIGFTLPINQNPEETERGIEACEALGIECLNLDLSAQFAAMTGELGGLDPRLATGDDNALKIRRGNIRARLRMITLYDQAHRFGGLVASTDNFSELTAGFWTKHGDVGDLAPIQSLSKSWEVPFLAREYGVPERTWRATPTDGLGISAGDEAQLGASYLEFDVATFAVMDEVTADPEVAVADLPVRLGVEGDERAALVLGNVLRRIGGTWFKRFDPIRLDHPLLSRYGMLEAVDARLFHPAVLRKGR